MLGLSLALVGFTTVSGQVILPMAGGLAAPQDRGRIVGIVTSGVVIGILFARTVSGFIANLAGWRSIYIVAAVLNIILIFALRKRIPTAPGGVKMPYPKLILSVFTEARRVPNVGPVLLIGGFGFCALQLFWTAITFLLAAPPFGYNTLEIGLVSLVGVAGALIAAKVGGLMDRGRHSGSGVFYRARCRCYACFFSWKPLHSDGGARRASHVAFIPGNRHSESDNALSACPKVEEPAEYRLCRE